MNTNTKRGTVAPPESAGPLSPHRRALLCTLPWIAAASTAVGLPTAFAANGEAYPSRPVTLVVPYPAGSIVDVRIRELAEAASRLTGQRFIVDNRPGATGLIGAAYGAKAKPDGYTVLVGTISELAVLPASGREMPFDPDRDLVPVIDYARGHMLLVTNTSLGVGTVQDLIALSRTRSAPLLYGTAGAGSITDFAAQLLRVHHDARVERVSYKSSTQGLVDLIPGRLQFGFDFVPTSLEHIRAGRLKPLMVTTRRRVPALPDVPTAREAGLPELEIETWGGLFVPRGTPPEPVRRLHAIFSDALSLPAIRRSFETQGATPGGDSTEGFTHFFAEERKRWVEIVRKTGTAQE